MHNIAVDIDWGLGKDKRGTHQLSVQRDERRSWDTSPMNGGSSSQEDYRRRFTKTREGEDKLRIICPVNYYTKTVADYRTYCLVDTSLKCDKTV